MTIEEIQKKKSLAQAEIEEIITQFRDEIELPFEIKIVSANIQLGNGKSFTNYHAFIDVKL